MVDAHSKWPEVILMRVTSAEKSVIEKQKILVVMAFLTKLFPIMGHNNLLHITSQNS